MRKFALALVPLAFVLSACAGSTGEDTGTSGNNNAVLDGDFTYGRVELPDGRVLECVTMKRSAGQNSWGGLDCNGWNDARPGSGERIGE